GNVSISNAQSLDLGGGSTVTNSAGTGNISVAVTGAGNDLTISNTVSAGGDITLSAADALVFAQAAGVTGVSAGGAATLTAGGAVVGNANAATHVAATSLTASAATGIRSSQPPGANPAARGRPHRTAGTSS